MKLRVYSHVAYLRAAVSGGFLAFAVLSVLLVCAFPAAADETATLNGRVVDPKGLVVAGAKVEAVNVETGVHYPGSSNADGYYNIVGLPAGKYHVLIEKGGFKSVDKTDVVLHIQEVVALNVNLEIGSMSEVVTVQAGGIHINMQDGTVSTLVDATMVANMPLNGRSFQDLILLTPGVVTNNPQEGARLGRTGEFSVNGQRTDANYYTVDGVSANVGVTNVTGPALTSFGGASGSFASSTSLGTTQALVSVDDLQEFRVQSSSYSAEYGRNPGGQISFQTKSGTNQWHGTAFEYLRNNAFDANDWFNSDLQVAQPALRQNDFGGTIGGPVRIPHVYNGEDKTFFFVSYEGLRLIQPAEASVFFVPDNCMRGVTGACTGLTGPSGNPRTPAEAALLPVLNTFPVQTSEFDPVNGLGELKAAWSNPSTINSTSIRLDQVINDRMTVFFRFSDTNSNSQTRTAPQALDQTPFLARTYTSGVNNTFSSRVSNELRFNYTSNQSTVLNSIIAFGDNEPFSNGTYNLASYLGIAPKATVENIFLLAGDSVDANQQGSGYLQRQWNITDTVSYSVGAHQFKFGMDYRRLAPIQALASPLVEDFFIGEPSIESGMFALGLLSNMPHAESPLYINFSAFAQDNWKVSRRLTLSLGLRWELNPAPGVTQGLLPYTIAFNGSNNPNNWGLAPYGTPLWQTTWFNFAPRLGAAYVLRDNPGWETVVRGGGGVFFDSGQQDGSIGYSGPGATTNFLYPPGSTFQSAATCTSSGPNVNCPAELILPIQNPPVGKQNQIFGLYPHLQLPYTLQWNFSVEQALGKSQALTVSYVGSHASRLLQETSFMTPSNVTASQFTFVQNGLTSDYDALQLQFQRRLSHGLTFLGSYTWSHCIDYGSQNLPGSTGFSGESTNLYQRGNCDFDVRQNFSAAFSYNLPNIEGNGFVRAVLDHWGMDDRFTARTAFPIYLSGPQSFNLVTGQQQFLGYDTVSSEPLYLTGATCAHFFAATLASLDEGDVCPGGRAINPCAFIAVAATGGVGPPNPGCSAPTSAQVGGLAPRNFVRGFDAVQMDLAIRREFPIYERLKLQFRAEAFNVFNHPNFGLISQSGAQFGLATGTLASSLGVLNQQYQMGGPRSMQFALKLIF